MPFDVTPMKGNGNLVSNVATLTWIATQYYIAGYSQPPFSGNAFGKSFASQPPAAGTTWIFNGSMPGTEAALVQYVTPKKRVAAMCVIVNTRIPGSQFLDELNQAIVSFLQTKFKNQ